MESDRCTDVNRGSRALEEDSHFAGFLNSEKIHRRNDIPRPINQIVSLGKEDRFHWREFVGIGYYWRVRVNCEARSIAEFGMRKPDTVACFGNNNLPACCAD